VQWNDLKDGWKALLIRYLVDLGLIPELFTGEITINCNQGGVTDTWVKIRRK
jgi:hypothetical protein